ncbi:MAG: hypothetical protein C4K47_03195 [Candidatus Thorarchaeota archaeon]|nr:MAG: hypothetical protein C4K47_03195 [Candidatus Thorarchaeota archaeon]
MAHCEFWLEMREEDNAFRVMLLLFDGIEPAKEYAPVESKMADCGGSLYASPWYPTIFAAEEELTTTARNYSAKGVKILVFREIRKPEPTCGDVKRGRSRAGKKRGERGR